MKIPTIAVTGLDARENPYPGLAIARSLRMDPASKYRIIALTYDIYCTGLYRDDIFDAVYIVPYPSEPEDKLKHRLLEIHREDPFDVIIPALDTEIAVYSRLTGELHSAGIRMLLPSEASVKARNKDNLSGTCRRLNIRTPKTVVVTHLEQLDNPIPGIDYPMVMKGSIVSAKIIRKKEELRVYYFKILGEWGFPVLLQERLVGEEYDIAAVADRQHKMAAYVPIKKFAISGDGKATAGVVVDDPYLEQLAREILERMKWIGPCELELIRESATGRYFLLEMNARFPAWIYLTAKAGCNMPAICRALAMNEPVPAVPGINAGHLFFRNRFGHIVDPSIMTELLRSSTWQSGTATGGLTP